MSDSVEKRIGEIRDSYEFILDRGDINFTLQQRINALQFLEKEMNTSFKDTEDFLTKMDEENARK